MLRNEPNPFGSYEELHTHFRMLIGTLGHIAVYTRPDIAQAT